MSRALLELLRNRDFMKGGVVNATRIRHLTRRAIVSLCEDSLACTAVGDALQTQSTSGSHVASLSLGGIWPCLGRDCRVGRAASLGQFAAFYSDRVYVHNFLAPLYSHGRDDAWELEDLRYRFSIELAVINAWAPLMEAGLISAIVPTINVCPQCFGNLSISYNRDSRLKRSGARLRAHYQSNIGVTLRRSRDQYVATIVGPDLLVEHGAQLIAMKKWPKGLAGHGGLQRDVDAGRTVTLSGRAIAAGGFANHLSSAVCRSIAFELSVAQTLGSEFLVENDVYVKILEGISDDNVVKDNQVLNRELNAIVPFLSNVTPRTLIKLRRTEGAAFLQFRAELGAIVREYRGRRGRLSRVEARQLYGDMLAPRLAKLDQAVRGARRRAVKNAAWETAGWVGAIALGVYSGFVPRDLATAAQALGLTQVLAKTLGKVGEVADAEEGVRQDPMYFLWKVRRLARGTGEGGEPLS